MLQSQDPIHVDTEFTYYILYPYVCVYIYIYTVYFIAVWELGLVASGGPRWAGLRHGDMFRNC